MDNTNKKRKFTAECKCCEWKGSKYKVILTLKDNICPNCNSNQVILYDKMFENNKSYAKLTRNGVRTEGYILISAITKD